MMSCQVFYRTPKRKSVECIESAESSRYKLLSIAFFSVFGNAIIVHIHVIRAAIKNATNVFIWRGNPASLDILQPHQLL
jgi:hypothetical protein